MRKSLDRRIKEFCILFIRNCKNNRPVEIQAVDAREINSHVQHPPAVRRVIIHQSHVCNIKLYPSLPITPSETIS